MPLGSLRKNILMTSIRQAFVSHAEIIRDYVVALIQVDSGIYNINQLKTILQAPDTTVRMETEWLQSLLETLVILQEYLRLVDYWANHMRGLARNLGATQNEINQFENLEVKAAEIIKLKDFDNKYLRWVLEDTAQELDRLIATSHHLLANVPRLLALITKFEGPFFNGVQYIAQYWQENVRRDLLFPLSTLLQETDTSSEPSLILQQFIRYLDTIAQVSSSSPMLMPNSSTTSSYSFQGLQLSHSLLNQIIQGTQHLRQFVEIRSQIYVVLHNEQNALWHAVLPTEMPTGQVLVTIGLNPSEPVEKLLPSPMPVDTLPIALKQAREALTIWNATMDASVPFLNKALVLNQLLQSPPIAKFLQADQKRLELYHEWRPRIMTTFEDLCSALEPS